MKYNASKKAGNELETLVKEMLVESKIPFKQENTMISSGKRAKGNIDFILENPIGYIECKRFTDRITVSYKSQKHDIKWSQIEFLISKHSKAEICGFVIQETNDKRLIYIQIQDFMYWWASTTMKSLTLGEALKIGKEIKDFEFINKRSNLTVQPF